MVLVWKKDGSLHFCIDFCHLNTSTKDSYPLPRIQEALESLVGTGHFFAWIWNPDSGRSRWMSCQSNTLHLPSATWASLSVTNTLWDVQCTSHVSGVNAELPWGAESNILPHLPWWHNYLLTDWISLTNLESITWNWSHPSVTFSGMKSPTYLIESWRMGSTPVTQTIRQSQNAPHHKPIWRYAPSSDWWATTGGSLKDSHALHNP